MSSEEDTAPRLSAESITQQKPPPLPLAQNFVAEMLSEIFILLLPKNNTPRLLRDQCPLNVSHVCRAWRNTALSTHKLWAGLHIICVNNDYVLNIGSVIQKWIARSGLVKAALRIEFPNVIAADVGSTWRLGADFGIDEFDPSWPSIKTLLYRNMEAFGRLTYLSIVLDDNHTDIFAQLSKFVKVHFRSLESLELHIRWDNHTILRGIDCTSFKHTFVRLTELKLTFDQDGGETPEIVWAAGFPVCPNLRKLSLDVHATVHQTISVLGKMPSIEEVVLHGRSRWTSFMFNEDEEEDGAPSTINMFTTIRVCSISAPPSYIKAILRASEMPSLQELTLDVLASDDIWADANLLSPLSFPINERESSEDLDLEPFISRSRPPLEALLITSSRAPMTYSSASRCLRALPLLRRLRICITEAIARGLSLPTQATEYVTSVCPLLEEIVIILPHSSYRGQNAQILWSALEDMVRSRRPVRRTAIMPSNASEAHIPKVLRRLTVPSDGSEQHPLYKCLKDVILEGFLLHFYSS